MLKMAGKNKTKSESGIELEFVSSDMLVSKDEDERIEYIMGRVKKNKIMILEGGLTPLEESRLIAIDMSQVSDNFPGIEFATLGGKEKGFREKIIHLLGGKTGGLTVVGPSKLVKRIKRDPKRIFLLASKK